MVFGRLNMDEFAMGSSTENSSLWTTVNPWDPTHSRRFLGGCAASVAANECFGSLGSDTGGSIRQPTLSAGIVGLKPTYGLVSRFGWWRLVSSLDQIGPFTKTVGDSATLLQAIAGHDPRDSTSVPQPVPGTANPWRRPAWLRIGLVREFNVGGVDPEVDAAVRAGGPATGIPGAETVEVRCHTVTTRRQPITSSRGRGVGQPRAV